MAQLLLPQKTEDDYTERMSSMNEQQARKRIKELKGFYGHLGAFIGTNLFLFVVNMINLRHGDDIWFVYPLFAWGIGLISHAFHVYVGGKDWEKRKMEELTGHQQTQDELARLNERTDNLVTILSAVNWEKIDPALVETRENLEAARDKITRLQREEDSASQAEVEREIQKLEEFVTSSKFDYYQLAAEDKRST